MRFTAMILGGTPWLTHVWQSDKVTKWQSGKVTKWQSDKVAK